MYNGNTSRPGASLPNSRVPGGSSFVFHVKMGVERGYVSQNDQNDININIRVVYIPSTETRRATPVRIS